MKKKYKYEVEFPVIRFYGQAKTSKRELLRMVVDAFRQEVNNDKLYRQSKSAFKVKEKETK